LHRVRHDPATVPAEREAATAAFKRLHGASQGMNLATLILVFAHWAAAGRAAGNPISKEAQGTSGPAS
jgi:hypothetical protein